jgi:hypothetical protein
MDMRRSRLGGAAEWLVAVAFLVATVVVAALIIREMRSVRTTGAPLAPAPQEAPPAAIPQGVISVPSLLLPDGRQVRVGDTFDQVSSEIGSSFKAGAENVEVGALGNRITRSCDYAGTKFVLVLEPYERNGPPRVTAIYLR